MQEHIKTPLQIAGVVLLLICSALMIFIFNNVYFYATDLDYISITSIVVCIAVSIIAGGSLFWLLVVYLNSDEDLDMKVFVSDCFKERSMVYVISLIAFIAGIALIFMSSPNKDCTDSMKAISTYVIFIVCFSTVLTSLRMIWGYDDVDLAESQNDETSIGALWAIGAVNSYYKQILKDIVKRMQQFEKENELKLFSQKFVIICPLSCNIEGTFERLDPQMTHKGNLKPKECDQGANLNRQYKNSVYHIDLDQDVYVAVEFASPLGALWKVREVMEPATLKYIRDCFIKYLKHFLRDYPSCIVLEYDDTNPLEAEPLHRFILSSLKRKKNSTKEIFK